MGSLSAAINVQHVGHGRGSCSTRGSWQNHQSSFLLANGWVLSWPGTRRTECPANGPTRFKEKKKFLAVCVDNSRVFGPLTSDMLQGISLFNRFEICTEVIYV